MNRRKFLLNLLLWMSLFVLGYKVGNSSKRGYFLSKEIAENIIHVKEFGALGNGTDETAKIQSAIDYASTVKGTLIFDKETTYMVNAVNGLDLRDNITIDMSNGARLKAIPNDQGRYRVLRALKVKNIKLISPTLIGEKDEHLGTTGEWGYGLELKGAVNVDISNFNAEGFWGDGVLIGSANSNDECSKNISFKGRTVVKNCRRQGMSVITVDGLNIESFYAENIRGTLPSAGIDFEPDLNIQQIKNVKIGTVTTVNAVESVLFAYKGLGFDITIKRVNAVDCDNSFSAYGLGFTSKNPGSIKIGTWFVNKLINRAPINLTDWYVGFTPKISIDNFILEDWNNSTSGYIPEDFCAYLRIAEKIDAAHNTNMLIGGGIKVGNLLCPQAEMGNRPLRYAYLYHYKVTPPVGFVFDDINIGISEHTVNPTRQSVGIEELTLERFPIQKSQ